MVEEPQPPPRLAGRDQLGPAVEPLAPVQQLLVHLGRPGDRGHHHGLVGIDDVDHGDLEAERLHDRVGHELQGLGEVEKRAARVRL